ncbi:hypothetical protein TNCV_1210581 [Trichonephila clavipes]|nr:hypothetical protein TNCV_1210581 [Trichonephila clavipes]
MVEYVKDLESTNTKLENEIAELNVRLKSQEIAFKTAELQIRADFLTNIEKLSKECNILRKEKESIVIRYANSEKEVILEKKAQQELEKKLRDINKERENLLSKIKGLSAENNRLSSCYESKMIEIAKLQKNFDKLNTDLNSREIRIKWLQNKLKTETSAHQETLAKLDHTVHRLNEMKEEAEQVRKDCQEMIKCYQEAEEIKSVKLDSQLKQKLSELEVQKQEKSDQDQVYQLLRHELEALKKKQRMTMEENNALTLKIHSLEKERLEYEQNLSKLKDNQNMLKQEIVDLTARLAEMETLRLQLDREKEKSAASLREVERLRLTNAELQADMNACHIKEGELLKFTEGVTDTNVKLQSAHSLLEVKAQALEDEMAETRKELADMQQKHLKLASEMETLKKEHEEEVQLLARKLAEKTKNGCRIQNLCFRFVEELCVTYIRRFFGRVDYSIGFFRVFLGCLANDDEIEGYILEKQELLDTWEEMLILLERRVSHLNKTNKSTEVIHTRNSDSTEIKLPTLLLPTFSGVIDEWLTFSDLFQAAVTNNQNLTGAQKLQYLKGVLKGDAQKIVQSLPITDGNFQIAWDVLKERYFHKREILSSLMKKLMNISPITCESHAQILKLVDSTKECVRLLETLDLKVEGTADIILMFIIQFKLHSTTRGWWERSLDNEKIPSLSELLQFLSNHARSLMTEGYGVKRNISNKKVTLVASGFQLHCSYCQSNHNLNKCDAFQNLSVQKKSEFCKIE